MSGSFEIVPVTRITAGAVGEPGERTFYLQAEGAEGTVTLLAEKEQVGALAQALEHLCDALPGEEGDPPPESELELRPPLEPAWRAGSIALEYDAAAERIIITVAEALPEDAPEEPATARFGASRAQSRAVAECAAASVAAGRPRCQFCGEPLDPDEHVCSAMNGHRAPAD